jgi:hypothetical protein
MPRGTRQALRKAAIPLAAAALGAGSASAVAACGEDRGGVQELDGGTGTTATGTTGTATAPTAPTETSPTETSPTETAAP